METIQKQFKLSLIRKLVPNTIMLYPNWIANATDHQRDHHIKSTL